jgi:FdhD protein
MRTPGNDAELALGFVLGEGMIERVDQIERISHCSEGDNSDNVISLIPGPSLEISPRSVQRALYLSSSCGVCGKRSMEQVFAACPAITNRQTFAREVLLSASEKLKQKQEAFAHCGALHGVGLMDTVGEILCVREDIGRHNAVDKVVGWGARNGVRLSELALVVSGRCSFEIIQKALMARISCVVAVGGVSSLAADLAKKGGITVAGFARSDRLSFYSFSGESS